MARNPRDALVRFVTNRVDDDSRCASGVFAIAYELQRESVASVEESDELAELLAWFKKNLAIPPESAFSRFSMSGPERRHEAISWFKHDAQECIARVWRLVEILRANEVDVRLITTTRPGYVTYEDESQLVAVPFNDTPTES